MLDLHFSGIFFFFFFAIGYFFRVCLAGGNLKLVSIKDELNFLLGTMFFYCKGIFARKRKCYIVLIVVSCREDGMSRKLE